MSVMTSFPVTPNRIKIIWEYVGSADVKSVDAGELRNLLAPPSLRRTDPQGEETGPGRTMGDDVVDEMCTLGLLERSGKGTLKRASGSPKNGEPDLLGWLEQRLLDPLSAERFRQRSFPMALSWVLTNDPLKPLEWGRNYKEEVSTDCGDDIDSYDLTNEQRWQQLVYWARYFGLAWRMTADRSNVVIPDPTGALARHLPSTSAVRGQSSISRVISEVAVGLPVLEGGTARIEVESRLPAQRQRLEEHLSRSTSFALERLERRGQVRLERLADAPALNLDLGSGPRPISHISWL